MAPKTAAVDRGAMSAGRRSAAVALGLPVFVVLFLAAAGVVGPALRTVRRSLAQSGTLAVTVPSILVTVLIA